MTAGRTTRAVLAAALMALAACADLGAGRPLPDRPVTPTPPAVTPESRDMQVYFSRVQRDLLTQGLLRTDGGGIDTPFSAEKLAENFMAIALFDELVSSQNSYIARTTASQLRRWEVPIRMRVHFGASVPVTQQAADRERVLSFADRLSGLTGVPIREAAAAGPANFDVLFLSETERKASAPLIRELVPGISTGAVNALVDMSRHTYCMVFAFSNGTSPVHTQALVVIRTEHPDLLREACIHEELTQAMGLPNDSPRARPSIFNDNEEFAYLTRHDELLLRILYDPRLHPGMTAEEARPVVEAIARELMGGES